MRGFFYFYIMNAQQLNQRKYDILQTFWGHSEFRDFQEEVIDSIIAGRDTLALLPTGGGKSLCYQLPALMLEGTCIVISPLLALMRDQVIQLKNIGIEAEYLSSELEENEEENIFLNCKNGITKLLYISPERIINQNFIKNIEEISVSFIAVDEAHCVSEWGQDFRPGYQKISLFRRDFKQVPCLALTATATPKVLEQIKLKLELKNPSVFHKSFRRNNLNIYHTEISDKYTRILEYLQYHPNSGIIYTQTRKEAEEMAYFLRKNNLKNVDFFHAGLPAKEKHRKQNIWLQSDQEVLVATNAFGMGIDKDNVRFVIHLSPPASIENYYQEIGRAGRDGGDSDTLLCWNEQELENFDKILMNQVPDKKSFINITSYLYSIFQIGDLDSSYATFELNISRIQNFTKNSTACIKNVLNFLHNQEIIFFKNQKTRSGLELIIQPEELDLLPKKDSWFVENLLRSIPGIHQHKVLFSEAAVSQKMGTEASVLKERLQEIHRKGIINYTDGAGATIKFLKPRNDRTLTYEYWPLFEVIQKNKLLKWEEMKYFIRDENFCKMKLILAYFGEKDLKNCGKCSVCQNQKEMIFGSNIDKCIIKILKSHPSGIEEISVKLQHYSKQKILESIIDLLDSGTIKMHDFRTYCLA